MTKNERANVEQAEPDRVVGAFLAFVVFLCLVFVAALYWAGREGMQKPPSPTPPLSNMQWALIGAALALLTYWLFPRLVATLGARATRVIPPSDDAGTLSAPEPAAPAPQVAAPPPGSTVITIYAPRTRASARPTKANARPKE